MKGLFGYCPVLTFNTHTHTYPHTHILCSQGAGNQRFTPTVIGGGTELWDLGERRGRLGLEGAQQGFVAFRKSQDRGSPPPQ